MKNRIASKKGVGKLLSIRDKAGQIEKVKITERPYRCALCSYQSKTFPHAMHPLYDRWKSQGQPLINAKDGSPIWVHTLCALFIGGYEPTGGLVYGCDENGKFESLSDESEGEGNDSNSPSSLSFNLIKQTAYDFRYYEEEKVGEEEDPVLEAAPHHFVITYKGDGASDATMNFLKESRTDLKCYVCKNPDMHSRRIAVQVRIFIILFSISCRYFFRIFVTSAETKITPPNV